MIAQLLKIDSVLLVLVALASSAALGAERVPRDGDARPLVVGVYDDVGVGSSINDLLDVLKRTEGIYIRMLTAEAIRRGELSQVDLLIHPGGSGSKQGNQLRDEGRRLVREFVEGGGGFVGVCAGAYLASADYPWSLHILDAKVVDRKHWARGTGTVDIEINEQGRSILQTEDPEVEIFYGQGPLLAPADDPTIDDFQSLAVYRSEIARNGAPAGVMLGTTAIAAGRFGKGRVLCFSPHPEKTKGLESFLHHASRWARGRSQPQLTENFPSKFTSAVSLTPDISQRGFSNGNHCAPCAAANILFQFRNRGRIAISYSDSAEPSDDPTGLQRGVVRLLADDDHMQTAKRNGTNRYRLVNGLLRFLKSQQIDSANVHYLGVREYRLPEVDPEFRRQVSAMTGVPTLTHLKAAISNHFGTIILFGSYKPDPENASRLVRVGGHYVAAVGYGCNEGGEQDDACVILHDSNDGHSGQKRVFARSARQPIGLWSEGAELVSSKELVQLAGAPIRKDGRIAFLETIITLDIPEPHATSGKLGVERRSPGSKSFATEITETTEE